MPERSGLASPLAGLDRVEASRGPDGLEVLAGRRIRPDEPYLAGHYPGAPIFPGVFVLELVVEAVRCAGVAGGRSLDELPVLDEVVSVHFQAPVRPGVTLTAHGRVVEEDGWLTVRAECRDENRRVAQVHLRLRHGRGSGAGGTSVGLRPAADAAAGPAGIAAVLPHRHPILLVDRVVELEAGQRAATLKAVTLAEPCFAGLPEGAPAAAYAYPSSLVLESFCQSGALLWLAGGQKPVGASLVFAVARGVRFHRPARPGDVLRHAVRLERTVGPNAFLSGTTTCDGAVVAEYGSLVAALRPQEVLAG